MSAPTDGEARVAVRAWLASKPWYVKAWWWVRYQVDKVRFILERTGKRGAK